MDNNLKLNIITALDNAGLKATQQQIDGIADKIEKFNKQQKNGASDAEKLNNQLTKMPGMFGKIAGGLGNFGKALGAVGAAVTVFNEARAQGEKFREWLSETFGDTIPMLKTFNQQMKEIQETEEQITKAYDDELNVIKTVAETQDRFSQSKQDTIKKNIDGINSETKAYLTQAETISNIKAARDDARILMLERQKFNEQSYYQSIGQDEAAEQIGRYYDIGIKQLQLENSLKDNAMQKLKVGEQLDSQKKKIVEYYKQLEEAEANYERAVQKLNKISLNDRAGKYKYQQGVVSNRLKKVDELKALIQNAQVDAEGTQGRLDALDIQGTNIYMRQGTAIGQAVWDYDKSILRNGDYIGAEIDEHWAKELAEIQEKSWEANKGILENTANLAEKIDELLKLK